MKTTAAQVWDKLSQDQKDWFNEIAKIQEQAKAETDPVKKALLEAQADAMIVSIGKELGRQFPE
jgi:hypothetical protein